MRKVTENHLIVTGLLLFCFIALFMVLPSWAWAAEESTIVYGLNTQYVVWHDNTTTDENYDIFFKKSADGGVTWEQTKNLSNNAGDSEKPSMAVDGLNLYVVWQDDTPTPGIPEIFFRKSTDGGVTWVPYQNISNNPSGSGTWGISIAVDGSKLYVVWTDSEGVTPLPGGEYEYPPTEIFFKKSLNGGYTWDDQPKKISNATNRPGRWALRASMAVDGQKIYVVWQDSEYPFSDHESFFNRSLDGGVTWEEPIYLGKRMCPVIAIDGPYLYVIRAGVNFRWSKDYGATWEDDVDLDLGNNGMEPFIAVDGSNIYAIWQGKIQEIWGIYFRKGILDKKGTSDTTDDVVIWDPDLAYTPKNISTNAGHPMYPTIAAVDSDNIYVVWYDGPVGYDGDQCDSNPEVDCEIFFTKSTDGGVTWEPPTSDPAENLSNNAGESLRPKITAYVSNIRYVVWHDDTTTDRNNDIFFKRSLDGGVTWEEPYQNLSNNTGESQVPSIAVNGSNLYVVWQDDTGVTAPEGENPPDEIFFTKSTDGGETWNEPTNISNNGGNSKTWSIAIAVDGLNLYVVWHDGTLGNNEIFFRRSTDGGVTWEPYQNLSNNARIDTRTSIAVDGQYIYVVWDDHMDSGEIFFRRSTDYGVTWDPTVNISNNASMSMCAVIAIDGPNLYIVWGNSGEILFRWSKDYGVTWEPPTSAPAKNISDNTGDSRRPKVPQSIATLVPCPNPPVIIVGDPTEYYSLQDAYDAAVEGDIILSHSVAFTEDLYIDRGISVTLLEGGYVCDYTICPGITTLKGTMRITNGTLTIGFFVLE